jgi:hypothetical protein
MFCYSENGLSHSSRWAGLALVPLCDNDIMVLTITSAVTTATSVAQFSTARVSGFALYKEITKSLAIVIATKIQLAGQLMAFSLRLGSQEGEQHFAVLPVPMWVNRIPPMFGLDVNEERE